MFRIAYGAGHYLGTAGRRVPAMLDPAQTREWVLNDRVARAFAAAASKYRDVELLRVDDPTGECAVSLEERCAAANQWGADFCLSIHHNAFQGTVWKGSGAVAFSAPGSAKGAAYRDAIYEAVVAAGGLRGDRVTPKLEKAFYCLRHTLAPAVLVEYGFMDSAVDAPVILGKDYPELVGHATMDAIARVAGLERKTLYRVQVGAFLQRKNAETMMEMLKNAGFEGYIVGGMTDGG